MSQCVSLHILCALTGLTQNGKDTVLCILPVITYMQELSESVALPADAVYMLTGMVSLGWCELAQSCLSRNIQHHLQCCWQGFMCILLTILSSVSPVCPSSLCKQLHSSKNTYTSQAAAICKACGMLAVGSCCECSLAAP